MKNLKLTIDLLPKGAWGTNLSKTLPKEEWDVLRHEAYKKTNNKCTICGSDGELHAHEVWDFNVKNKTQTLIEIIALCPSCHMVKHMRNSIRLGYGEHVKNHFIRINQCGVETLAAHYIEAESLYNDLSKIIDWTIIF